MFSFIYSRFCALFGGSQVVCSVHICLHVSFAVNAALLVGQRQHRTWTIPFHLPANAKHKVGQVATEPSLKYDQTGNRTQPTNFGGICSTKCST